MAAVGRSSDVRRARAFAPGHLSGFFAPELSARDPRARGSVGAGLVLDRGVTAEARWTPSGPTALRLSGRPRRPFPVSREVARRLRAGRPGTLEVDLAHELPIGQGFGMSAAGALATALAVGRLFRVPVAKCLSTAHLADLSHRGGLGGVAALGGGGLEWRRRAGVPPWGRVDHRPLSVEVYLAELGPPIPSPSVLGDPARLAALERAGRAELRRFARTPTLAAFLDGAERFTDRVGLLDDARRARMVAARRDGWRVAQAMFGRTLFAVRDPRAAPRRSDGPTRGPPGRWWRVGTGRAGARRLPDGASVRGRSGPRGGPDPPTQAF